MSWGAIVGSSQKVPNGPPLIVLDTFTRADSNTTLGNAETGQAWTALVGTWGASSGKAYLVTSGGGENVVVLDCGLTAYSVSCKLSPLGHIAGIVACCYDIATYLVVKKDGGNIYVDRYVSSGWARLATIAVTWIDGDVLRVDVAGANCSIYQNGNILSELTTLPAGIQGLSKCGFYATTGTNPRWDDFAVVAL